MTQQISYVFNPGQRSILVKIYFPKKIKIQGTIFNALDDGLHEERVHRYLEDNVVRIMLEIAAYPHWFDPNRYGDSD